MTSGLCWICPEHLGVKLRREVEFDECGFDSALLGKWMASGAKDEVLGL